MSFDVSLGERLNATIDKPLEYNRELTISITDLQKALPSSKIDTVAPTVSDDATQGYEVGSQWYDVVAKKAYTCLNPAPGAAEWKVTTGVAVEVDPNALWNDGTVLPIGSFDWNQQDIYNIKDLTANQVKIDDGVSQPYTINSLSDQLIVSGTDTTKASDVKILSSKASGEGEARLIVQSQGGTYATLSAWNTSGSILNASTEIHLAIAAGQKFSVYSNRLEAKTHLIASTDNTIDLGSSDAGSTLKRFRDAWFANRVLVPQFEMDKIASPANPATGKMKLYFKADSQLYKRDDAGNEVLVGGGGVETDPLALHVDGSNSMTADLSFTTGADRTISQNQAALDTHASNFYLKAQDADPLSTVASNGGDLYLEAGNRGAGGVPGYIYFKQFGSTVMTMTHSGTYFGPYGYPKVTSTASVLTFTAGTTFTIADWTYTNSHFGFTGASSNIGSYVEPATISSMRRPLNVFVSNSVNIGGSGPADGITISDQLITQSGTASATPKDLTIQPEDTTADTLASSLILRSGNSGMTGIGAGQIRFETQNTTSSRSLNHIFQGARHYFGSNLNQGFLGGTGTFIIGYNNSEYINLGALSTAILVRKDIAPYTTGLGLRIGLDFDPFLEGHFGTTSTNHLKISTQLIKQKDVTGGNGNDLVIAAADANVNYKGGDLWLMAGENTTTGGGASSDGWVYVSAGPYFGKVQFGRDLDNDKGYKSITMTIDATYAKVYFGSTTTQLNLAGQKIMYGATDVFSLGEGSGSSVYVGKPLVMKQAGVDLVALTQNINIGKNGAYELPFANGYFGEAVYLQGAAADDWIQISKDTIKKNDLADASANSLTIKGSDATGSTNSGGDVLIVSGNSGASGGIAGDIILKPGTFTYTAHAKVQIRDYLDAVTHWFQANRLYFGSGSTNWIQEVSNIITVSSNEIDLKGASSVDISGGPLIFYNDNTIDIGKRSTTLFRPKDVYVGNSIVVGDASTTITDDTIKKNDVTSGAGNDLIVEAGGTSAVSVKGGNLDLKAGANISSGNFNAVRFWSSNGGAPTIVGQMGAGGLSIGPDSTQAYLSGGSLGHNSGIYLEFNISGEMRSRHSIFPLATTKDLGLTTSRWGEGFFADKVQVGASAMAQIEVSNQLIKQVDKATDAGDGDDLVVEASDANHTSTSHVGGNATLRPGTGVNGGNDGLCLMDGELATSKKDGGTGVGSQVDRMKIFDETGSLIGYIPIYAAA